MQARTHPRCEIDSLEMQCHSWVLLVVAEEEDDLFESVMEHDYCLLYDWKMFYLSILSFRVSRAIQ